MPNPGGTTARGYGAAHQRERARWRPRVDALKVTCWRCDELIIPDHSVRGDGWDLGHDDNDRSKYAGPEHVDCNRATRGRRVRPRRRWVL